MQKEQSETLPPEQVAQFAAQTKYSIRLTSAILGVGVEPFSALGSAVLGVFGGRVEDLLCSTSQAIVVFRATARSTDWIAELTYLRIEKVIWSVV